MAASLGPDYDGLSLAIDSEFIEHEINRLQSTIMFNKDWLGSSTGSNTDVVEGERNGSNQWFSVCLISGKNREVRKLFQSLDMEVSRLKRTRFGPIFMPSSLRKGQCLSLSNKEIESLKHYGT